MSEAKSNKFETDIELGVRYVDQQTGISGTATAIYFYQHACERVCLEFVVEGKLQEVVFDAPRLTHAETRKAARSARPGGPRAGGERPAPTR